MRKAKRGDEVLCNCETSQLTFNSKHEASRVLGLSYTKINRLIEKNLPVHYDGKEYRLDELFTQEEIHAEIPRPCGSSEKRENTKGSGKTGNRKQARSTG